MIFFVFACSTWVALGAQGSDPAIWPIVYQDDFEDSESGWEVEETEYATRAYVGGAYEMQVKDEWSIAWSQIPGDREFLDFSAEIDAQVVEGTGEFGFLFRYQDADNFYKFTIGTDGHYRLILQEQGTGYTLLDGQVGAKDKTKSKVEQRGIYRLKVVAEEAGLAFFLYGKLLAASTDSSFRGGQIALCAETFDEPRVVVRFTRLEVRSAPDQQSPADRASWLYSQGWALYESNGYEAALAPLSEAYQLFESLGWVEELGQSAYLLAYSLYSLARYQEALFYFWRAANAFLAVSDYWRAAFSMSNHGRCLMELGEYKKALESFQQAHSLYQKSEDTWGIATTLLYSSMSCAALGDYRTAIEAGEVAIALYKTRGDRLEIALTSNTLALYYILLGDYTMARWYSIEALTLFSDLDDPPGLALACAILGHTHWAAGEIDLAAEDFKQALSISSTATDFPLDLHAMILEGLARCLLEQEEHELARRCLELAQSIRETLGDPRGKAATLSNLGGYWYTLGEYEKAMEYYEASLAITMEIKDKIEGAMNLGDLGNCYSKLADHQRAIDCYRQGLQLLRGAANTEHYTTGVPEVLWRLYWGLGASQYELGEFREAAAEWMRAVDVIEGIRARLAHAELSSLFMWEKLGVYWHLVTALLETGDSEKALSYAERAKARTLVDMMETAMLQRMDVVHSRLHPLAEILGDLSALLDAPIESFSSLIAGFPIQSGVTAAVERAQQDYIAIRTCLEREYPVLGDTLAVEPTVLWNRVQDVQSELGEGTVALEYFVTDKETIVWVIIEEGIQTASRVAITRDELTEQVRGFREEIESPPVLGQEAVSYLSALEKGHDLYELLITPVEKYLQGATHLVIVPSDVLFYLPFGALYICPGCKERDLYGGKFLIEDYSISYAPSMSSLYWPLQHAREGSYDSILAVGNPTGDLAAAEQEVRAAADLFSRATLFIGEEGTEAAVKRALQTTSYDVVHLSTHGLFDHVLPLLSQLAFREGEGEDGALYAGEILGLSLTSSLIVLSACQTALPPELTEETEGLVVGDELQGLSQALFVAGASSAILTLWNVNDVSTSHLMQVMYNRLMGGVPKGEALRQAQLSLLQDTTYRHPYFWAPFVLYGIWR
jgi:CHAT domain-containing protein/Tfp pilus assembly protein PilF